jgi:hypothetical protein
VIFLIIDICRMTSANAEQTSCCASFKFRLRVLAAEVLSADEDNKDGKNMVSEGTERLLRVQVRQSTDSSSSQKSFFPIEYIVEGNNKARRILHLAPRDRDNGKEILSDAGRLQLSSVPGNCFPRVSTEHRRLSAIPFLLEVDSKPVEVHRPRHGKSTIIMPESTSNNKATLKYSSVTIKFDIGNLTSSSSSSSSCAIDSGLPDHASLSSSSCTKSFTITNRSACAVEFDLIDPSSLSSTFGISWAPSKQGAELAMKHLTAAGDFAKKRFWCFLTFQIFTVTLLTLQDLAWMKKVRFV